MPVIRFVREGRDVECYPGENLREVALREGIEIYGLKGRLGNCGGCGQCITCFVDVLEDLPASVLSERTAVEIQKLRRRPKTWRLACQTLVQQSLLVLTRPQVRLPETEGTLAEARTRELPEGPMRWPVSAADDESEEDPSRAPLSPPPNLPVDGPAAGAGEGPFSSATSDEASSESPEPGEPR